jgi:hypothetical protein
MKKKTGSDKSVKVQSTAAVRASISSPPALYETLEDITKQKKVSLAWVVTDAGEKYVDGGTAADWKQTPEDDPPRRPLADRRRQSGIEDW